MSFHVDLFNALKNDSAVAGLVGDSIFDTFADGTTESPYLIIQTISATGTTAHDGSRNLVFPLVQVTAWARTRVEALNIAAAVVAVLDGKLIPGYSESVFTYDDQTSDRDDDTKLFSESIDFRGRSKKPQTITS